MDAGDAAEDGGQRDAGSPDDSGQPDSGAPDGGAFDAGESADAGGADAGLVDAGGSTDAGDVDAGPPTPCWGTPPSSAWPGPNAAMGVDDASAGLAGNASGLVWHPSTSGGALFSVNNNPPRLHRLVRDGASGRFINDPIGWSTPRDLTFPSGSGDPDAEGVTIAAYDEPFVYVVSETSALIGRTSFLRYDLNDDTSPLPATHEWNVSVDLAGLGVLPGSNSGFEAITWIPDADLTAGGLLHGDTGEPYDPADYPDHAGGLFVGGVEADGRVFAFPLMLDGTFERVAEIESELPEVMPLEYDREERVLLIGCDNNCDNAIHVALLDNVPGSLTQGTFVVTNKIVRPSSLPNSNQEGIALADVASAVNGMRPFFWIRDGSTAGATLSEDGLPVGAPCR
jgi:hypothetical protein